MGTIAEKLNYLNTTKTNIKNAIVAKGVSVSDNDTFRSYASKIADIEPTLGTKTITANGTYTASDDSLQGYSSVTVDIDDTDLYRDTTDSTYESVKTLSNCGAFPMLSLTAEINAVQEGSGDPSPSNIRPIIGWSAVDVSVVGKNWWGKGNINGVAIYEVTGLHIPIGTWTFSANVTSDDTSSNKCLIYDLTQDHQGALGSIERGNRKYITFTTDHVITSIRFYASTGYNPSQGHVLTFTDIQLEEGSIATDYEPYNATITIQLGDTYYGGKLDVVSGELVVTDGYIASYNGETLPSTWISDRDVYAEGSTPTTGAEVCYKLATPQTIQLTPTAVKSLLGSNNIWADTGDVGDVRYFKQVEL